MPSCAVPGCHNHNLKIKKTGGGVVFHQFPKDPLLSKKWVQCLKRKDKVNINSATICSAHFTYSDYKRDLRNELLGEVPRKRGFLLETAIPTQQMPLTDENLKNTDANAMLRCERLERRRIRSSIISGITSGTDIDEPNELVTKYGDISTQTDQNSTLLELENTKLKRSINLLKMKMVNLKNELSKLRQFKWKASRNNSRQNILESSSMSHCQIKKIFSNKQIQMLKTGKRVKSWTTSDIAKSLTLRSFSKKSYQFIRKEFAIPLPGLTTLRDWTKKFKLTPGTIQDVINLLHEHLSLEPIMNRLCSLSFDEVSVDSKITFDESLQQIIGPHSNMGVMMARGICAPWKQPVYFNFDTFTKIELTNCIQQLYSADVRVKTLTTDLCTKNVAIYNQLGVSKTKPYFDLEVNGNMERIFVFPDFPHLLKCFRNSFLDYGIFITDDQICNIGSKSQKRNTQNTSGHLFTKQFLIDLLNNDCGEYRVFHHLSEADLNVEGQERQHYSTANRLFSEKTAAGIRAFATVEKYALLKPKLQALADFIKLISDYKDLMLSAVPNDTTYVTKSAFGMFYQVQMKLIRQVTNIMERIAVPSKVGNLRTSLLFMNGIRQSTCALPLLLDNIKQYGVKYIMCKKLTQNCLENLFGQIRGLGRHYDHPPPTEAKNRLRILLLGQHTFLSKKACVEDEELRVKYVSSLLLGQVRSTITDIVLPNSEEEMCETMTLEVPPNVIRHKKTFAETEGEIYVAGYIAAKIRQRFPHLDKLGSPTCRLLPENISPWIRMLSFGGLTQPSEDWLAIYRKLEECFTKLHGQYVSLNKSPSIIQQLMDECKKCCPELPHEVIRLYARTRNVHSLAIC